MRKLLVLLESGLLFVGLCVGLAAWQQQRALEQPLQLTEERLLDVSSGSTPGGMLARLEQEEVLHGAFWLRLYWRFNLPGQALHSGEYRLLPGMTGADLLELWREGEVVQYSLTLVEGWSFRQVREALARQGKLEQTLAGLSDGALHFVPMSALKGDNVVNKS
ncbi:endolytic transglycosylase MltG, partial [Pseudomonas aeruginosa]|uniref:endolytic transglycosylase MltG n=1 Tax=Pseudomonas aeruginosa TaxID=287 RepID=UPI00396A770E